MKRVYLHIFALLLLMLAGCFNRPDPTVILGNWRAETFKFDSVGLPIAPNIQVTRNEMVLKSPDGVPFKRLPLASIRAEGETIELEFREGFGVSVVFVVDSSEHIRFKIPMVGITVAFTKI